jgi:hypothetical protein
MPDKALDPVEWELVRADIAMEKARLKANGDWSKWEEFQTQTNARLAAYRERRLIGRGALRGGGLPMTEEERFALWWAVRAPELSVLMGPPQRTRAADARLHSGAVGVGGKTRAYWFRAMPLNAEP